MVTISCGNIQFTNIQAIIFDKDGTLENSGNFLRELGQKRARMIDAQIPGIGEPLLMAFGICDDKIDPTGLMAVGSRRENEIAAAAYIAETGRSWFESLAIAANAFSEADLYCQKTITNSPLFPGSLEVITLLAEAGVKLGIVSADSTMAVQSFLELHQLSDFFEVAMGVDSHISKPDPRLFIQACQTMGVKPNSTLMVGDGLGDIEMANQAGSAGTIGICWHNSHNIDLEKADVIIQKLTEISIVSFSN